MNSVPMKKSEPSATAKHDHRGADRQHAVIAWPTFRSARIAARRARAIQPCSVLRPFARRIPLRKLNEASIGHHRQRQEQRARQRRAHRDGHGPEHAPFQALQEQNRQDRPR